MSKPARASPRKFSEKIALLNKKESETNAAFESIIKEVEASTAQRVPLITKSNLIPAINQHLASRQQRRLSTTLKRSLSCRASSRERSLSSVGVPIGQPVAQRHLVATGGSRHQTINRRSSYTYAQPHNQVTGGRGASFRAHYINTEDGYHDLHVHQRRPSEYTTYQHPQRNLDYEHEDYHDLVSLLDQPYSLPVVDSEVPNINIFHIEDEQGNDYADPDDDYSFSHYQQVNEPTSHYLEPIYAGGAQPQSHDGAHQQQHRQLYQQPQQSNNQLTSMSLTQPYTLCNSRSLPNISNLGFGSSDEISVYGSPYGEEPSPLVAYETNNHVNYCTTTAGPILSATTTDHNHHHEQQHQQQQQRQQPQRNISSGQSYRASPPTKPVMTHDHQQRPQQQATSGTSRPAAIPAIQILDDSNSVQVPAAPPQGSLHEATGSFLEETHSVSYHTQADGSWNQQPAVVANPHGSQTHTVAMTRNQLSPENHPPQPRRQEQFDSAPVIVHHLGPMTKSVSTNALYEQDQWTDNTSSYMTHQPAYYESSQLSGQNRLSNHLSRSYNSGLHDTGQSFSDLYWNSNS